MNQYVLAPSYMSCMNVCTHIISNVHPIESWASCKGRKYVQKMSTVKLWVLYQQHVHVMYMNVVHMYVLHVLLFHQQRSISLYNVKRLIQLFCKHCNNFLPLFCPVTRRKKAHVRLVLNIVQQIKRPVCCCSASTTRRRRRRLLLFVLSHCQMQRQSG